MNREREKHPKHLDPLTKHNPKPWEILGGPIRHPLSGPPIRTQEELGKEDEDERN